MGVPASPGDRLFEPEPRAEHAVADDAEREWGKQDWAEKSADYAEKGYIPVSMKTDFAQIYPEGITPAAQQYTPVEQDVNAAA